MSLPEESDSANSALSSMFSAITNDLVQPIKNQAARICCHQALTLTECYTFDDVMPSGGQLRVTVESRSIDKYINCVLSMQWHDAVAHSVYAFYTLSDSGEGSTLRLCRLAMQTTQCNTSNLSLKRSIKLAFVQISRGNNNDKTVTKM
jgi:hypothetical protein